LSFLHIENNKVGYKILENNFFCDFRVFDELRQGIAILIKRADFSFPSEGINMGGG